MDSTIANNADERILVKSFRFVARSAFRVLYLKRQAGQNVKTPIMESCFYLRRRKKESRAAFL